MFLAVAISKGRPGFTRDALALFGILVGFVQNVMATQPRQCSGSARWVAGAFETDGLARNSGQYVTGSLENIWGSTAHLCFGRSDAPPAAARNSKMLLWVHMRDCRDGVDSILLLHVCAGETHAQFSITLLRHLFLWHHLSTYISWKCAATPSTQLFVWVA